MRKKIIYSIVTALILAGCGGSSSDSKENNSDSTFSSKPRVVIKENSNYITLNRDDIISTLVSIENVSEKDRNDVLIDKIDIEGKNVIDFISIVDRYKDSEDRTLLIKAKNRGNAKIEITAINSLGRTYRELNIKVLENSNNSIAVTDSVDFDLGKFEKSSLKFNLNDGECLTYEVDLSSKINNIYITGTEAKLDNNDFLKFSTKFKKIDDNIIRYGESIKKLYAVNSTNSSSEKAGYINGMEFAFNELNSGIYNLDLEISSQNGSFYPKLSLAVDKFVDCDGDMMDDRDEKSECLNTPSGEIIDTDGCSLSQKDSDGDSLNDDIDKCIDEIGPEDNSGCPYIDSDGDGFYDNSDECVDEIGTVNGCPDSDGDGVADKDDKCPTKAGEISNSGCPVEDNSNSNSVDNNTDTAPNSDNMDDSTTSADNSSSLEVDDADACTTNNGYQVASHQLGETSFANGYLYFRTTTPYLLKLYYRVPEDRSVNRAIDLESYNIPNTNYQFFLEVSTLLADGSPFFVKGNGYCFKGYMPVLEDVDKNLYPDKNLKLIK